MKSFHDWPKDKLKELIQVIDKLPVFGLKDRIKTRVCDEADNNVVIELLRMLFKTKFGHSQSLIELHERNSIEKSEWDAEGLLI